MFVFTPTLREMIPQQHSLAATFPGINIAQCRKVAHVKRWRVWGRAYLEHLLDPLPGQVDIELVEELQHLADAEAAVAVLIRLRERLLQPRGAARTLRTNRRHGGAARAPLTVHTVNGSSWRTPPTPPAWEVWLMPCAKT